MSQDPLLWTLAFVVIALFILYCIDINDGPDGLA